MRWTERQQAMLREMGIVLFARPGAGEAGPAIEREADVGVVDRPTPAAPDRPLLQASPPTQVAVASERVAGDPVARQAEWLVVGDAIDPASESGAAEAQLLDQMLRAIGLSQTAPVPARRAAFEPATPGNDATARIDSIGPRCIVALGRHAAAALLETSEPLGALRGRVHARAGVPVIVTFSLAYLMRHPADKAKAWADLCLAVRTLQASSP